MQYLKDWKSYDEVYKVLLTLANTEVYISKLEWDMPRFSRNVPPTKVKCLTFDDATKYFADRWTTLWGSTSIRYGWSPIVFLKIKPNWELSNKAIAYKDNGWNRLDIFDNELECKDSFNDSLQQLIDYRERRKKTVIQELENEIVSLKDLFIY